MGTRSALNGSLPEPTYFVDRDLGNYQLPDALAAAGLRIVKYSALFDEKTTDDEWLARVGAEGWIGLTHDRKITKDSLLIAAALRADVRLFILRGKKTARELADNFLLVRRRVELLIERTPGPFIAKVYIAKDGSRKSVRESVQLYINKQEWLQRRK